MICAESLSCVDVLGDFVELLVSLDEFELDGERELLTEGTDPVEGIRSEWDACCPVRRVDRRG